MSTKNKSNVSAFKEIKYAAKDYVIHKVTFLSFDVGKTINHFKKLFEKEIVEIDVPDPYLKKRGIRWLLFPKSGMHIHVAPPPPGKTLYLNILKEINIKSLTTPVQNMPIKESHVGLRVPDLTQIIKRVRRMKYLWDLRKRADGMYQLYLDIDSAVDYFEIDSKKLDAKALGINVMSFAP
jgi:hypothetical protein